MSLSMHQLDDKGQLPTTLNKQTKKKTGNLRAESEKPERDDVNKHKAKLCLEDAKTGYTLQFQGCEHRARVCTTSVHQGLGADMHARTYTQTNTHHFFFVVVVCSFFKPLFKMNFQLK